MTDTDTITTIEGTDGRRYDVYPDGQARLIPDFCDAGCRHTGGCEGCRGDYGCECELDWRCPLHKGQYTPIELIMDAWASEQTAMDRQGGWL